MVIQVSIYILNNTVVNKLLSDFRSFHDIKAYATNGIITYGSIDWSIVYDFYQICAPF